MQIDVVIPTRNRLWAVKRALPYYLNQKEIRSVVVVDDGSDDGTFAWLAGQSAGEPRVRVLRHDVSKGACAARNAGIEHTSAPFLFFADDDMFLRPSNGFAILLEELEQCGGDIIGTTLVFPEGKEPEPLASPFRGRPALFHCYNRVTLEVQTAMARMKRVAPGSFPSALISGVMLVRRAVTEAVRYDEGLGASSYRDETDFQLKATDAGFKILCCDRVFLADMERTGDTGGCHSQSLLAYELQACRNNWRVLRRHRKALARLGAPLPIAVMQGAFVFSHLCSRLPRGLFVALRRWLRNVAVRSHSTKGHER